MHGYPVMQVVQYHIPPAIQPYPPHHLPHAGKEETPLNIRISIKKI